MELSNDSCKGEGWIREMIAAGGGMELSNDSCKGEGGNRAMTAVKGRNGTEQ